MEDFTLVHSTQELALATTSTDRDTHHKGRDLSAQNLNGQCFAKQSLRGADLSRTLCCGSDFHLSDLSGADLSFANLRGAILDSANFSGANLSHVNFDGATVERAIFLDCQGLDRQQIEWLKKNGAIVDSKKRSWFFAIADLSLWHQIAEGATKLGSSLINKFGHPHL